MEGSSIGQVLRASSAALSPPEAAIGPFVAGAIESHPLPGAHKSMLVDERVHDIAALVGTAVDDLDARRVS